MRPRLFAALFLLAPLASPVVGQGGRSPSGWPTATPAAAGVRGQVLDSIASEIERGDYGYVDRMLVIRGGRIVFDRSFRHNYDAIYADSARTRTGRNGNTSSETRTRSVT